MIQKWGYWLPFWLPLPTFMDSRLHNAGMAEGRGCLCSNAKR